LDLALQRSAARLGAALVDQAGGEIGVDRHLLAGQRVQSEARCDLGHAARAARDDREVDREQDQEDDRADDQAAADREAPEGLDDVARGARALAALEQDEAGGRDVQAQAEERGDEQQRREDREIQGLLQAQRHEQDQHRDADVERQQDVQRQRRQRQDQDRQYAEDGDREQALTGVVLLLRIHRLAPPHRRAGARPLTGQAIDVREHGGDRLEGVGGNRLAHLDPLVEQARQRDV